MQAAHPAGPQQVTDLGHLNDWWNKAAHQGTLPLGGARPAALTLPNGSVTQILSKGAMSQERLLEPLRRYVQLHVNPPAVAAI